MNVASRVIRVAHKCTTVAQWCSSTGRKWSGSLPNNSFMEVRLQKTNKKNHIRSTYPETRLKRWHFINLEILSTSAFHIFDLVACYSLVTASEGPP
jgi:hypothetical protein